MKSKGGISSFWLAVVWLLTISCTSEVVNQDPMVILKDFASFGEIKITDLNKALKLDRDNAGLYAKRAKLYLQEKQFGKALADIEQAIKFNSNQAEYYFWKALILRDAGQISNALAMAEEAEKLGLKGPNGFFLQAELLTRKKRFPEALQKVTLGLQEEPDNEFGLFYKGLARAETRDTASAILLFRRAINNAPEFVPPYLQLASIFNAYRNFDEANHYLKLGAVLEPANGFLWYQRGLRYDGIKKPDSAYTCFSEAVKLDTDLYLASYQLALLDYKRRNYVAAAAHLNKIKSETRNLPQAQEIMAESLEKTGRFAEAIVQYNQVLTRKPNDVKSMWGVRRSAWGIKKMQRDSLRRYQNNFYREDTTNI